MKVEKQSLGFLPILALIFITLKLTGFISWSWWLVLSPLLVVVGLAVIIIVGIGLYTVFKK